MGNILKQSFFDRSTKVVAQDLLGKYLVRRHRGVTCAYRIVEVEVYDGVRDKASHASRGRTARTEVMFGSPGRFYVYLCYGMYYMLNIVTRERGYPAAILIRGVEGISGPGRVTRTLGIGCDFHGASPSRKNGLWFEDRGDPVSKQKIRSLARVGVSYAGPVWSKKKWRFVVS